jgi:hypothetical protein
MFIMRSLSKDHFNSCPSKLHPINLLGFRKKEISSAQLTLVIDNEAFEHIGLLDFNVLVQVKRDNRLPAKQHRQ